MKTFNAIYGLTLGLALLTGCGSDINPANIGKVVSFEKLGSPQGNLRLIATDAPFSYDKVVSAKIAVDKIEAIDTNSVATVVSSQQIVLDLVVLRNGMVTALADINLPAGEYSQLRLHVINGSIDLTDGTHLNLKVPSGDTSGLKINISPAIKVSTKVSHDILLDFDLSKSFVPKGSDLSNGFNFKPVIRMANLTTAGTAAGIVMSDNGTADAADDIPLSGAIITISQNSSEVAQAMTDAKGGFKVLGLPAGDYSVSITHERHNQSSASSISVIAGNVTSVEMVTLTKIPDTQPQ